MKTDMFERKQAWRRRGEGPARTSQTAGYLIAGAILGIALVLLIGYEIGHAPVDGLEAKNTALTMQAAREKAQRLHDVAILQAYIQWLKESGQRHCVSSQGDIRNIQRLMGNADKPPCNASGLAMIYFSAGLDDLESSPPSVGADQSLALRFERLNTKADALGLDSTERESPLTTAASAYRNQLWSLSRAAFQLAWKQQLVGPVDKEPLGAYYAATVNQAKALTILQVALFGFVGVLVLGSVTAVLFPMTAGTDLNLICWSFFAFCVSFAACGWYARKYDPHRRPEWGDLDTHLDFTPASNRRTLDGSKDSEDPAFSRGEGAT
jgi:hypothetical protein